MKKTITKTKPLAIFRWVMCTLVLIGATVTNGMSQTVTITCTGTAGSYASGSVNSSGVMNDGNMITINSSSNRGWAHFDLSSIPASAIVSAVTANFYTYSSTTSSATNNVYGFTGDPSTTAGTTLYANCANGTSFNASTWSATGNQAKVLNATGIAFVQANCGGNNANLGYVRGSTNTYNIYGYPQAGSEPSLTITYTVPSLCSGTPAPGNTLSTASSVCSGVNFTLSTQNSTSGSGVTYQWQSSPDDVTYSNIVGATTATLTTNITTATYFQCVVTCSAGPSSGTSTPIQITLNSFENCYCTPTTTNGCTSGDHITNVTFTSLVNPINNSTGTCLVNSYSDYTTTITAASVSQGDVVPVSVHVGNGGTEYAGLWIDFDHSGTFDATEFLGLPTPSNAGSPDWQFDGNITIPYTALTGITRMRVRSSYNIVELGTDACSTFSYGETEDYFVDIASSSNCSGTPAPGNTLSTVTSICPNTNFDLSLQNSTIGAGVTYQWQSSPDNVTYTDIAGETSTSLTISQSTATYYQCLVTCTNSSSSATSTPVQVTMNTFDNCYCTPTTTGGCSSGDHITNVTFNSLVNPINNSTGTCLVNSYSDYTTTVTAATVSQGDVVPVIVHVGNGGTEYAGLWIDFDHSGTFEATEFLGLPSPSNAGSPDWQFDGNITIPNTALTGITRMRVRSSYNTSELGTDACTTFSFGETEDYLINIAPFSSCSGTPAPGNTISSLTTVCSTTSFTLSTQNTVSGGGITYQWQSSTDNTTYTDIVGATSSNYTTTQPSSTYYQCLVTCPSGPSSGTSTPLQINMDAIANCYCTPSTVNGGIFDAITGFISTDMNYNYSTSTGLPSPGYEDLTATLGTAFLGSNNAFEIDEMYSGDAAAIWIDFNDNGSFEDAGELVATTGQGTIVTGSVSIPFTVALGNHRLRIRNTDDTSNPIASTTSCSTTNSYGETKDFTITIIPAYDMGIANILTPVSPACYSNAETISVTVQNYGLGTLDMSINPLTVNCDITGANPNNMTLTPMVINTGLINAGGTLVVTFSTPYDMSAVGTYDVTVSTSIAYDGSTSNDSNNESFVRNADPVVTASVDNSIVCEGSNITLTGGGANTYTWDNGATDGLAFAASAATTTFVVTGTDIYGCSATASTSITVNTLPIVTASVDNSTVCEGSNITLTGGGADTYTWDNGATNGVAFVASAATTTFVVTGTDLNGCTNTASTSITVNSLPTVTATADFTTVCEGSNVTLTGGGASSYAWDNGVTDGVAFATSTSATYIVTGTDANSCVNTASVSITVNPLPTVSASVDNSTVCEGSNITLTGGGADTYTWDNGATDGVAFAASAATTTFLVTGTDLNGCVNTASTSITVNSLPTVTATAALTTLCAGSNDTLTGGGAVSYVWDNGATDGAGFVATATTTYVVTGTDLNGCVNTASVTVNVNPLPVVTLDVFNPTIVCDDAAPFALPAGLPAGGIYSGLGVTGTDYTPTALIDGLNTVTYTVTELGCTDSASQTIYVSNCVGINQLAVNNEVSIYPNPSSGLFTLHISNASIQELVITVTDIQGREIYKALDKIISVDYTKTISLENIAKGIYYIHINNGVETSVQKIVTQ
ncbi:MAG: GEVED domain-containing protein [Bacteroidota bacterium]